MNTAFQGKIPPSYRYQPASVSGWYLRLLAIDKTHHIYILGVCRKPNVDCFYGNFLKIFFGRDDMINRLQLFKG
jgi:hypothetical protein